MKPTTTPSPLKGYLYALLSASAFGFIPFFSVPVLQSGMHTPSVLVYRMLFSVCITALILLLRRQSVRIARRQIGLFIGLAFLYTLSSLFLLESYLYIPTGVATTIHFLYPAFVTVCIGLFFKGGLSLHTLLPAALSLVGVALLSMGTMHNLLSADSARQALFGILIVLITVAAYGGYLVIMQQSSAKRLDSLVNTFYVLCFTLLFCTATLYLRGEHIEPIPDTRAWISLILLGVIPTVCSNLFLVLAIRHIGSRTTAVLGCMEPVTAVVLGIAFLGEHLIPMQYVGILIILLTVGFVIVGRKRPA